MIRVGFRDRFHHEKADENRYHGKSVEKLGLDIYKFLSESRV